MINCILLLEHVQNELPLFGKVADILVLPDGGVYIHVNILTTEHFDQHYHAYCVTETLAGKLVPLTSLMYPFVLHLYCNSSKEDIVFMLL